VEESEKDAESLLMHLAIALHVETPILKGIVSKFMGISAPGKIFLRSTWSFKHVKTEVR